MSVNQYADANQDLLGWHNDMSNEDYHGSPGISKSSLDMVNKSINHLLNRQEVRKETPQMVLGTAVHAAILEPNLWPDGFVRGPDADMRTKEWKDARSALPAGVKLMKPADYDKVEQMAVAALSHPDPVIGYIKNMQGIAEGSLFQRHPQTGLLIKCRPDFLSPEHKVIVDVKTTKNASPEDFAKSCGQFRYDVQAAMYTDMVTREFGGEWKFVFIAVENQPPFNVGVYVLSPQDLDFGSVIYNQDIAKYAQWYDGYETNTGYQEECMTLQVPAYFRRNM